MPRSLRIRKAALESGAPAIAGELRPSTSITLTPRLAIPLSSCLAGGCAGGLLSDYDDDCLGWADCIKVHFDSEIALVHLCGRIVLVVAFDSENLVGRI